MSLRFKSGYFLNEWEIKYFLKEIYAMERTEMFGNVLHCVIFVAENNVYGWHLQKLSYGHTF